MISSGDKPEKFRFIIVFNGLLFICYKLSWNICTRSINKYLLNIICTYDFCLQVNGKYVVKSGTDFHNFSKIYITFENGPNVEVSINEIKVDSSYDEDEQLSEELEKYTGLY